MAHTNNGRGSNNFGIFNISDIELEYVSKLNNEPAVVAFADMLGPKIDSTIEDRCDCAVSVLLATD